MDPTPALDGKCTPAVLQRLKGQTSPSELLKQCSGAVVVDDAGNLVERLRLN